MNSKNQMRRQKRKLKRSNVSHKSDPAPVTDARLELQKSAYDDQEDVDVELAAARAYVATHEPISPGRASSSTVEPSDTAQATKLEEGAPDERRGVSKSSVSLLARKFDWITEASPLFSMYQNVSARFKRPRGDMASLAEADENAEGEEEELKSPAGSSEEIGGPIVSNKRRRKESKPKIADLKKQTRHPELVEWYDADARDPDFLIFLKSLPHAVQVPSNWRSRTESPSFPPQPPYELPMNIANTGIRELRDPNGAQLDKPARMSVDYEKLHNAFFENREVPQLSEYGKIRDPRIRTPAFKPKTGDAMAQFVPGFMSSRLHEALGLSEDAEAPWAEAMRIHGSPPAYRHRNMTHLQLWGAL